MLPSFQWDKQTPTTWFWTWLKWRTPTNGTTQQGANFHLGIELLTSPVFYTYPSHSPAHSVQSPVRRACKIPQITYKPRSRISTTDLRYSFGVCKCTRKPNLAYGTSHSNIMNIIIIVLAIVTLYLYIQKYIKVIPKEEESSVDRCVRRLCPKHWSALEEDLGQLRDLLHVFLHLLHVL